MAASMIHCHIAPPVPCVARQVQCLGGPLSRRLPVRRRASLSPRRVALAARAAAVLAATREKHTGLAQVWRELHGSDDWAGLLEPLHPLLREELVRYGDLVSACYKGFDPDPSSTRYLNCMYGKRSLLREVGMAASGYEVIKYVYATPDISLPMQRGSSCGRWVGFVAVADNKQAQRLGRRDVAVAFRGTVASTEWIANLMSSLVPARLDPLRHRPDVKVERGFLSMYTSDDSACRFSHGSCREQLLRELSRVISKYKGEEMSITFAGHSMGSSLAILAGYDLAELGLNRDAQGNGVPITVYSFGGPRVGNAGIKHRCEDLGVKILRVVNVNDPVTKLPGVLLNENMRMWGGKHELPWSRSCYAHVGVELALDFFSVQDPAYVHDLEAYLTLLRCPNKVQVRGKEEDDILDRARRFLSGHRFDEWLWRGAVIDVGNLVQSLGS